MLYFILLKMFLLHHPPSVNLSLSTGRTCARTAYQQLCLQNLDHSGERAAWHWHTTPSVATGTLPPAPVVSPTGIKCCRDRHSPTDPCSCYVFKEGPPLLNACVSPVRNTHLRETCWNTEAHCQPSWSLESRGTKSSFLSIPLEILEFQGFLAAIFKHELF